MTRAVIVDYKLCSGCRLCEIACSLEKEKNISPVNSRIKVYQIPPGLDIPILCVQCDRAPCINSCPQKAIEKDRETNAVIIHENECIGCGLCVNACPANAIFLTSEKKAVKCDLCGGEPKCVEICPTNALSYVNVPFDTRVFAKKPEEIAEELCELLGLPIEVNENE